MNNRRRALWVATGLCMPVLILASFLAWLQVSGNFAPVVEGEVYRSNQPTPERLADYQAAYGIRTVLNLRGAAPDEDWYALEKQATDALGMTLIDVPLSSTQELSDQDLRQLVDILRTAEKPILIHCRSGANRTGLAAAIYLAAIEQIGTNTAGQQLSVRYGHVAVPYRPETSAMDRSWERFRKLSIAPENGEKLRRVVSEQEHRFRRPDVQFDR
ncbi:MAG: phosphatase domain-containing protein [Gemmobacter sp.]